MFFSVFHFLITGATVLLQNLLRFTMLYIVPVLAPILFSILTLGNFLSALKVLDEA